jgi:hypothetical protein
MPGGRRNPISLSRVVEAIQESKSKARDAVHKIEGHDIPLVDLEIQVMIIYLLSFNLLHHFLTSFNFKFIGASGLPRLDVVGSCDPYFVAKIDDKITYVCVSSLEPLNPCSTPSTGRPSNQTHSRPFGTNNGG